MLNRKNFLNPLRPQFGPKSRRCPPPPISRVLIYIYILRLGYHYAYGQFQQSFLCMLLGQSLSSQQVGQDSKCLDLHVSRDIQKCIRVSTNWSRRLASSLISTQNSQHSYLQGWCIDLCGAWHKYSEIWCRLRVYLLCKMV